MAGGIRRHLDNDETADAYQRVVDAVYDQRVTAEDVGLLRDKVRSKIEVAKVLGGAITLTLGWLLTSTSVETRDIKAQVAVLFLLVSLALFIAMVDAYDTLLMPPAFWEPWTQEFSVPWAIHDEMIRAWKRLFVPAATMLGLGLVCLVLAVMQPTWLRWRPDWEISLAGLLGAAAVVCVLGWLGRPAMLSSKGAAHRWTARTRKRWRARQRT